MTKSQAHQEARRLRAAGKVVKIFCHSGVYTQPGRGIVPFVNYEVRIVA